MRKITSVHVAIGSLVALSLVVLTTIREGTKDRKHSLGPCSLSSSPIPYRLSIHVGQ
jgi:hypothetical protein